MVGERGKPVGAENPFYGRGFEMSRLKAHGWRGRTAERESACGRRVGRHRMTETVLMKTHVHGTRLPMMNPDRSMKAHS